MTSATTIHCDQAIFTSIRTPMGEGYRIIAASRGLAPTEKQTITRYSPSHEALCVSNAADDCGESEVRAAAFYVLPTGRLCAACSCYAGAEHTGRGGQRVYTQCLVFADADFAKCAFNPFVVLRAAVDAQLTKPQLKPPAVLEAVELPITATAVNTSDLDFHPLLSGSHRPYLLEGLLGQKSFIVQVEGGWLPSVEALLMGLPGPLRKSISFSAGIRFSVGRCYRLAALDDDARVTQSRIRGKAVEYVDPSNVKERPTFISEWTRSIERCWERRDWSTLTRRTSRAYQDVAPAARERVATLFQQIDAAPTADFSTLLRAARTHLNHTGNETETAFAAELVETSGQYALRRLDAMTWDLLRPDWQTLAELWRLGGRGRDFATPLVAKALRVAMLEPLPVAAEVALSLLRDVDPATVPSAINAVVDQMLDRLVHASQACGKDEREQIARLAAQWQRIRPQCSIVEKLTRPFADATAT